MHGIFGFAEGKSKKVISLGGKIVKISFYNIIYDIEVSHQDEVYMVYKRNIFKYSLLNRVDTIVCKINIELNFKYI